MPDSPSIFKLKSPDFNRMVTLDIVKEENGKQHILNDLSLGSSDEDTSFKTELTEIVSIASPDSDESHKVVINKPKSETSVSDVSSIKPEDRAGMGLPVLKKKVPS